MVKDSKKLCYNCNNYNSNISIFTIENRNYGSIFEWDRFQVQLCEKCLEDIDQKLFSNESINSSLMPNGKVFHSYYNEHILYKYLSSFPLENQEYVFNCDNAIFPKINREEWIKQHKA